MCKATLISLLTLLATAHAFAAQAQTPITLQQLRSLIVVAHQKDRKLADRLYHLQLTQRLSPGQFSTLRARLPGRKSRLALLILADESQFLPPPPSQIPHRPAPTILQQQAIINRSIAYVVATIHRLPNLYARIHTLRYRNAPAVMLPNSASGSTMVFGVQHKVDRSAATVLYRDGREVIQKGSRQHHRITPSPNFMSTYGEFGPIFSVVFGDLPNGKLQWARWSQTPAGKDAVFRFSVPRAASHYMVGTCCRNDRPFSQINAYHGELTIAPSTGTILRLTILTDPAPPTPLAHWGMMVQYGPVTLGGKQYFCPVKSVSIYRGPVVAVTPNDEIYDEMQKSGSPRTNPPMQTQVNQTLYSHYHLFRAGVKIFPYKSNSPAKPGKPGHPHAPSGSDHPPPQPQ